MYSLYSITNILLLYIHPYVHVYDMYQMYSMLLEIYEEPSITHRRKLMLGENEDEMVEYFKSRYASQSAR